jgi:hypothetical protein
MPLLILAFLHRSKYIHMGYFLELGLTQLSDLFLHLPDYWC